jgi:hypothetical protein
MSACAGRLEGCKYNKMMWVECARGRIVSAGYAKRSEQKDLDIWLTYLLRLSGIFPKLTGYFFDSYILSWIWLYIQKNIKKTPASGWNEFSSQTVNSQKWSETCSKCSPAVSNKTRPFFCWTAIQMLPPFGQLLGYRVPAMPWREQLSQGWHMYMLINNLIRRNKGELTVVVDRNLRLFGNSLVHANSAIATRSA